MESNWRSYCVHSATSGSPPPPVRAPSERPFRSQDAAILARDGYAVEESGEVIYYAPDADVLLSDTFAATHCFQLTDAPPGQPGLIGLRFRPVEAARDRRDIEGTFWLDRASAELRSLDFTFTNLPGVAERVEPGGRVEFTRLPQSRSHSPCRAAPR